MLSQQEAPPPTWAARATFAVAGLSISLLLLLGSLCLAIAYSGKLYDWEGDGAPPPVERRAVKWLFQHFLPLLVWLPVYASTETGKRVLPGRSYWFIWAFAVIVVVPVYAGVLGVLGVLSTGPPAFAYVHTVPFGVAFGGIAFVPWVACSFV